MTFARRLPVALGAICDARDLERVGDLAKNIAKCTVKFDAETRVPRAIVVLKHTNEVVKDVPDGYAQRHKEQAVSVSLVSAKERAYSSVGSNETYSIVRWPSVRIPSAPPGSPHEQGWVPASRRRSKF